MSQVERTSIDYAEARSAYEAHCRVMGVEPQWMAISDLEVTAWQEAASAAIRRYNILSNDE